MPGKSHVHLHGDVVIHAVLRRWETNQVVLDFAQHAVRAQVPTPPVLATGRTGPVDWHVTRRVDDVTTDDVDLHERAARLAELLHRLHVTPPGFDTGSVLRLDNPNHARFVEGWVQVVAPTVVDPLRERVAAACRGLASVPVHCDVSVTHNSLMDSDGHLWLIDPWAVRMAPAEYELGVADAFRPASMGSNRVSALYPGRLDQSALEHFLQANLLRRAVVTTETRDLGFLRDQMDAWGRRLLDGHHAGRP